MVETPEHLSRSRVDLYGIIEDAVRDTQERYDVECRLTGSSAVVSVDPLLLRRVCRIVIQNASQARSQRVDISINRTDVAAHILFRDDGEGMSRETCADVFRLMKRTQRSGGRRGVGLIVARRIIEGYGGTIELDSVPGEGTRVRLSLPVAREDAS